MRIGIDAKWYFSGPPGGHTYVRNILGALARLDRRNEYLLYTRYGDPPNDPSLSAPGFLFHPLWPNLSFFRVRYALARRIARDKPDLVFTQSLIPKRSSVPRIVTVHDLLYKDFPEYFSRLERMYFRFIDDSIRKADMVVAVSEYTKERLQAWFSRDPSTILVTTNSANENFRPLAEDKKILSLRERYHLPEEFLLYVGRLNIRKNLPRLFRALKKCAYDIPLVCVGKRDWKADPLERVVHDLGMERRILFTGYVPDEEIPLFMNLALGFVFVSLAEGFGIPALEAMACGAPVIASNTTSLPEVVGGAGILVDPESEEEITEGINKLLSDSGLREDLRKKGLLRSREFTWEGSAQRLIQVFEKFS